MSRQCFLDSDVPALEPGNVLDLDAAERRHADVKRLGVGERVDVVDGAGTRYVCSVVVAAPELELRVDSVRHHEAPRVRTRLVQALAKGDRDLQAVETCVEIGVDAITPWQADRSIVRWKGERAAKAHTKWQAQVSAAVKQSRRAFAPPVAELVTTRTLADVCARVAADGGLPLVLHEEATTPLTRCVRDWLETEQPAAAPAPEVVLIVGPEGGISPEELDALQRVGARAVLVGEHVMRASTAGAAALVLTRAALGVYD
jgi:16S rRNA (uracil1498-N3)-methyltransferase